MKKINIIFFVILLLHGCYDDKSKSALFSESPIVIDIEEGVNFNAYIGVDYELYIPIIWNGEDSTKYHFQWKSISNEKVSEERVYNTVFNQIGHIPLIFEVIHTSTGLVTAKNIIVDATSIYTKGWIILSERNEESILHFINLETQELYPDVYNVLYPNDKLGYKPRRIEEMFSFIYDSRIQIFQDEELGSVALDTEDFSKVVYLNNEFIGGDFPYPDFVAKTIESSYSNQMDFLLTEKGEIYTRQISNGFAQFSTVPLSYPDDKGTRFSRIHKAKMLVFNLLFDELNNRWLPHFYTNEYLSPIQNESQGVNYDFCEGMDDDIELVFGDVHGEESITCSLINILRNKNTGEYFHQFSSLALNNSTYLVTATVNSETPFAEGYNVNEDTQFCLLRNGEIYLFFNVDNKLYFHRQASSNNPIYLFKDFSTLANPPTGKVVSIHEHAHRSELGIAFSDGHFFILDINPTLMQDISFGYTDPTSSEWIDVIEKKHYSGLDKIVHSTTKYGVFSEWWRL